MTIRELREQAEAATFCTAEQMALIFNCSEDLLWRLAARGEVPALRVGTLWRFEREEAIRVFRDRQRAIARKREGL